MGLISGHLMGGFPVGILPGLLFGIIFSLLIVAGAQWIKYSRRKALDRFVHFHNPDFPDD
jgi:hypothetical protein